MLTPFIGMAPHKVMYMSSPTPEIMPSGLSAAFVICGVGSWVRPSILVHVPFHKYWNVTVRFETVVLAGIVSVHVEPEPVTTPDASTVLVIART